MDNLQFDFNLSFNKIVILQFEDSVVLLYTCLRALFHEGLFEVSEAALTGPNRLSSLDFARLTASKALWIKLREGHELDWELLNNLQGRIPIFVDAIGCTCTLTKAQLREFSQLPKHIVWIGGIDNKHAHRDSEVSWILNNLEERLRSDPLRCCMFLTILLSQLGTKFGCTIHERDHKVYELVSSSFHCDVKAYELWVSTLKGVFYSFFNLSHTPAIHNVFWFVFFIHLFRVLCAVLVNAYEFYKNPFFDET